MFLLGSNAVESSLLVAIDFCVGGLGLAVMDWSWVLLRYKASGVFHLFPNMICMIDCYFPENSLGIHAFSLFDLAM